MRNQSLHKIILLVLLSVFTVPFVAFSQTDFEGKVTMKMQGEDNEPHTINYYVKENKIRFEADNQGQQGTMIWDGKNNKMTVIVPQQKMYMELPMNNMLKKETEMGTENNQPSHKINGDFEKTDETKEINGYKTEKWTYKDNSGITEAWMTKDLGAFIFFNNPMARSSNQPTWQKEIENAGYFPMMVIHKDENGNITSKMEVTSVEKKSLDNSMFEAPSDYKKMNMPMMNK